MANTFKNKVYSGSTTSADAIMNIYTAPSATTTVVIGLTLANTTTRQITADIKLSAGQTVFLAKNIPIPSGSSSLTTLASLPLPFTTNLVAVFVLA